MPTAKALQTWPPFASRLLRSCLCVLGVLLVGPLAPAEDEPKLAGVEVPAPKRTRFVSPEYPDEAKAQGQRGIVILSLLIDTAGKVASVEVVRSVPAFDEAAVAAARLWEYEITKVAGQPVPVRLSVPITFALRLPEVTRGPGVPELRAGLAPNRPAGVPDQTSATVIAALTVEPSGQVVTIAVEDGDWPWFESVAAALRTWAFVAGASESVASYQVEARFLPVRNNQAKVELRIERKSGAGVVSTTESPAPAVASTAAPEPSVATPVPTAAPAAPVASTEAASQPTPPAPPPAPSFEPPVATPVPTAAPVAPDASTEATPQSAPPRQVPSPSPQPGVLPEPVAPTPSPTAPTAASGVSAVRDVTLGAGVPDLASGRRPVLPPLARLGDVFGVVEARFGVDAGGVTSGIEVSGPELLQRATRQTVASWSFRRTSTERLLLIAVFEYGGLRASATVTRAPE